MTFHEYALAHADELTKLTCDMTLIPAPSGHERARAEYCAEWLKNAGAEGVEIDEFCNVIWKAFPGKSGKWVIGPGFDFIQTDWPMMLIDYLKRTEKYYKNQYNKENTFI